MMHPSLSAASSNKGNKVVNKDFDHSPYLPKLFGKSKA
jgi:hypothetical protein